MNESNILLGTFFILYAYWFNSYLRPFIKMIWIIVIIALFVVILYGIQSLHLLLFSSIIGLISFLLYRIFFFTSIADLIKNGNFLYLVSTDNSIKYEIDNKKINKIITKYDISTITYSVVYLSFIILFYFASKNPHLFIPLPILPNYSETHTLTFIVSIITLGILIKFFSPNNKLKILLLSKLDKIRDDINANFKELSKIDYETAHIEHYSNSLNINFPITYKANTIMEIHNNQNMIFGNPNLITEIILNNLNIARTDHQELSKCLKLLNEFKDLHNKISLIIFKTRSESFVLKFDNYLNLIEESKNKLIPQKQWSLFKKLIDSLKTELKNLETLAESFINNRNSSFSCGDQNSDPYKILEVERDESYINIHKKYKDLAKAFHPDKFSNTTSDIKKIMEEWFKSINEAFDKIKKTHNR